MGENVKSEIDTGMTKMILEREKSLKSLANFFQCDIKYISEQKLPMLI
jgi:hypothetical protein